MSDLVPKKMLILNIYKILREHSDAEHPLSQKNIVDILRVEYDMDVDRKAVKRNLEDLENAGVNIRSTVVERVGKYGEKEEIHTDWYLLNEFSNAELHFIIDSLMFAKNVPPRQLARLIDKIKGLSGKYFKHTTPLIKRKAANSEYFLNIEIIYEAIEKTNKFPFATTLMTPIKSCTRFPMKPA